MRVLSPARVVYISLRCFGESKIRLKLKVRTTDPKSRSGFVSTVWCLIKILPTSFLPSSLSQAAPLTKQEIATANMLTQEQHGNPIIQIVLSL